MDVHRGTRCSVLIPLVIGVTIILLAGTHAYGSRAIPVCTGLLNLRETGNKF